MLSLSSLSAFYILIGTFNGLVTFIGLTNFFFLLMSVLGIFILRHRSSRLVGRKQSEPETQETYRTWLANPIIFCAVSVFILLQGVVTDPLQAAALLGMVGVGWGVYHFKVRDKTMMEEGYSLTATQEAN
jgi:L-type amino acid transporter 6